MTLSSPATFHSCEWIVLAAAQSAAFQVTAVHALFVSAAARTSIVHLSLRLGVLAPLTSRLRSRRSEPPLPLEVSHPAAALALRKMQREPGSRLLSTAIGSPLDGVAIGFEDGLEGNLLMHYLSPAGALTLAGGWLGSGRRRYIWLPMRPTLAWNGQAVEDSVSLLRAEEMTVLAADLHAALTALKQRHVIEEFLAPEPIPMPERMAVLNRYRELLESHGWTVTIDVAASRRSLLRTTEAKAAHGWMQTDREELARLEALVTQMLKGVRTSSRVLYEDK